MPVIVVILLSAACLFFGGLCVRTGWGDFSRALRSRRWPKADGLVEAVDEHETRLQGENPGEIAREYRVRFSYVVAGRALQGSWTSLASTRHRPGACRFRAGDVVDVFYDPAEPSVARLFRRVTAREGILVIGGAVFLALSVSPIVVFILLRAH